jgi:hypothetical protein
MKNRVLVLIACIWMAALAAHAHPTVAGRVKSYSNGILTIELEDKSLRKLIISKDTQVQYRGASSVSALPVGAKISAEILGNVVANPAKAGRIVDWSNSSQIVAKGAKAPYHTAVGQYATTSGDGGIPDGAPVGQHAASHTLGAVAHGGSINAPTPENHSVGPGGAPNPNAHSTMGQPYQSSQYPNQGVSTTAPLEMLNISPYGNGQPTSTGGQTQPTVQGANGAYGADASSPGMYPQPGMDPGMYGMDPSLGMSPVMQPGMDPSLYGMSNPYAASNLGVGQSGNLMGINGGEDGDYSASGDMMGLGESAYGGGDNKITGSILQVDMQRAMLTIQPFTNPNPVRVFMGPGSSASPDLLIPGKMVEITGRATPQGFQAIEIQAAAGF